MLFVNFIPKVIFVSALFLPSCEPHTPYHWPPSLTVPFCMPLLSGVCVWVCVRASVCEIERGIYNIAFKPLGSFSTILLTCCISQFVSKEKRYEEEWTAVICFWIVWHEFDKSSVYRRTEWVRTVKLHLFLTLRTAFRSRVQCFTPFVWPFCLIHYCTVKFSFLPITA